MYCVTGPATGPGGRGHLHRVQCTTGAPSDGDVAAHTHALGAVPFRHAGAAPRFSLAPRARTWRPTPSRPAPRHAGAFASRFSRRLRAPSLPLPRTYRRWRAVGELEERPATDTEKVTRFLLAGAVGAAIYHVYLLNEGKLKK